jgi:hypothetical protein
MGGKHPTKGHVGYKQRPKTGEDGFKPRVTPRPKTGEDGFKPRVTPRLKTGDEGYEQYYQGLKKRPSRVGNRPAQQLRRYQAADEAFRAEDEAAGMSKKTRAAEAQQIEDDTVQQHATPYKNVEAILATKQLRVNSATGSSQSMGVWTQEDRNKCVTFVCKHHREDVIASDHKIAVFRISKKEQLDKGRLWTFNDEPQHYPPNMNFYMSSSNIAVDRGMMTVVDVRNMFNAAGTQLLAAGARSHQGLKERLALW